MSPVRVMSGSAQTQLFDFFSALTICSQPPDLHRMSAVTARRAARQAALPRLVRPNDPTVSQTRRRPRKTAKQRDKRKSAATKRVRDRVKRGTDCAKRVGDRVKRGIDCAKRVGDQSNGAAPSCHRRVANSFGQRCPRSAPNRERFAHSIRVLLDAQPRVLPRCRPPTRGHRLRRLSRNHSVTFRVLESTPAATAGGPHRGSRGTDVARRRTRVRRTPRAGASRSPRREAALGRANECGVV